MGSELEIVPNPPALASALPDNVLDLVTKVPKAPLSKDVVDSLHAFQRAANYIAAGNSHCSLTETYP
jgi:xylulose-5-phosphate/fructose-6-phosphate phosphoketolase